MIGGVNESRVREVELCSQMSRGMLSRVEIIVEIGNGIGKIPLLIIPFTISISKRVNYVSSSPVESGGVEELIVRIPLH